MGDIDRLSSGKWQARWRDDTGHQRKKSFRTKALAQNHLNDVEHAKHTGHYIDPNDRTTVAEYAQLFATIQPHGPRTAKRIDAYIRNHLAELSLGKMRLQKVRATDVQAWATDRSRVLADTTMRNTLSFVRSVFASAVHDGRISRDPSRRVRLPEPEDRRTVPLTVAQVKALHTAMPPRQAAMVIVQAGLGLRAGELLGLRVSDVNFLRREVSITCQLEPGSKERARTDPKTRRSRRTVPLPRVVAEALAAHLTRWPAGDDGSIWTTRSGRVPRHEHYMKSIKLAVTRVNAAACEAEQGGGKDPLRVPADATSHALRHHYASILIFAGASVIEVAERLGHKDAALVLRVYGHLFEGQEDRTRRAIDAAWDMASNEPSSARDVPPVEGECH
jgi:integrase